MSASQAGLFSIQEFSDSGALLAGGRVYTYVYGTTTLKVAYTDIDALIPHTYTNDGAGGQYIALNARGELPAPLYLASGSYDIALKGADGSTIWTRRADSASDGASDVRNGLATYIAAVAASAGSSLIGFIQAGASAIARTLQAKARDVFSLADWGVVGDDSTDDTAKIINALNEVPAGATLVLRGTVGEIFKTTGIAATRSNITLRGSAKPKSNSAHTALEGGTIIRGTFVIDGDNLTLEKFGVDSGVTYSNAVKGGVGDNGLVVHSLTLSAIRRGITVRDVIGMARVGAYTDSQAAFHAVLLEGLENGATYNVTGVGGLYGVVHKVSNWTFDGLTGIENDTAGVYIKSNTYGPVANVVGTNVVVIAGGSRAFFGLLVSASDAELDNVNVEGVTVIGGGGGGAVCITGEVTQPAVDVNVTGITTRGTLQGVVFSGPVYASRAEGVIDKPSNGMGLYVVANSGGTQPNDVRAALRINVDNAQAAINQVQIPATQTRVFLERIYATISYGVAPGTAAGKVQVTANTQIGDVFGVLSCDLSEANLLNGWAVFTSGQHCGTVTRNGITEGYGRIKAGAATSDVFMTLPPGSFPAGVAFLTAITGFIGSTGLPANVYVSVASNGDCSISPGRSSYSATVSYYDLTTLRIAAQLPVTSAF